MMTHDQWLEYILEIVRAIASRRHQEEVWLGPRQEINWVGDLYDALDKELFEDFFEKYSDKFTVDQLNAWNRFNETFMGYGDKLPTYPDPKAVISDPDWQVVRDAAAQFVAAFEQKHPAPSVAT